MIGDVWNKPDSASGSADCLKTAGTGQFKRDITCLDILTDAGFCCAQKIAEILETVCFARGGRDVYKRQIWYRSPWLTVMYMLLR